LKWPEEKSIVSTAEGQRGGVARIDRVFYTQAAECAVCFKQICWGVDFTQRHAQVTEEGVQKQVIHHSSETHGVYELRKRD